MLSKCTSANYYLISCLVENYIVKYFNNKKERPLSCIQYACIQYTYIACTFVYLFFIFSYKFH